MKVFAQVGGGAEKGGPCKGLGLPLAKVLVALPGEGLSDDDDDDDRVVLGIGGSYVHCGWEGGGSNKGLPVCWGDCVGRASPRVGACVLHG